MDGTKIAYDGARRAGGSTLHVIGVDGSGDVEITHGGHEVFPDWSPDGKRIVYSEGQVTRSATLGIVNSDGTNDHQLTAAGAPSNGTAPAWSPDGTLIAFTTRRV